MPEKYNIFILYPIPLIAIEVLDKEGAAIDTIFYLTLKLVRNPKVSRVYFNMTLNMMKFSSFQYSKEKNQAWVDRIVVEMRNLPI